MEKGFWEKLAKPIVGLSPMDGVTDAPMRFIAKKYGRPDVIYTEFVSVEGLWRIKKRGEDTHKIWNELKFDMSEHPVVAQLFGSDPDSFYEATKIVAPMGFDGIDINMGCPSPGLEKRGGGAGLMRDSGLAHRVIEAVRKAVNDVEMDIPVSVKTRIGSSKPDTDWWKFLAGEELPVVAMHGRTFKQLYSGEADWEVLREASKIIKESGALFLGNGDVEKIKVEDLNRSRIKSGMTGTGLPQSLPPLLKADLRKADRRNDEDIDSGSAPGMTRAVLSNGREIDLEADFDGVLVGRKAIGNPWALRKDGQEPSMEEKLKVAIEHARVFEQNLPGNKFEIMRKHLTWYAHGFDGAGGLRRQLVVSNSADEVEKIVTEFLE
jgi:tRNA-dihydrouridine synthase B